MEEDHMKTFYIKIDIKIKFEGIRRSGPKPQVIQMEVDLLQTKTNPHPKNPVPVLGQEILIEPKVRSGKEETSDPTTLKVDVIMKISILEPNNLVKIEAKVQGERDLVPPHLFSKRLLRNNFDPLIAKQRRHSTHSHVPLMQKRSDQRHQLKQVHRPIYPTMSIIHLGQRLLLDSNEERPRKNYRGLSLLLEGVVLIQKRRIRLQTFCH
jgi:hypothetical protein